jgi:carbon starvation protein
MVWAPLGRTDSLFANWGASALFVSAWGYFLYQGVIDPLGGINSLWPIFGVANQLLAVMALSLGLTVLLKMGRARYAWVAALPLTWLVIVTTSAGWLKIFSSDPRLGFLSAASGWATKLAAGGTTAELQAWRNQLWNNTIDAGVTALFLVFVFLVLGACARVWWQIVVARKVIPLAEDPYRDREAFTGGDAAAG